MHHHAMLLLTTLITGGATEGYAGTYRPTFLKMGLAIRPHLRRNSECVGGVMEELFSTVQKVSNSSPTFT